MSQKWICSDCGETFDEEDAGCYSEWEGEGVMRGEITYMCCPKCGSDSLEEAEECDWCGETYDKYDLIHVDDTKMCKKCAEAIHDAYEEKWVKMKGSSNA